MYVTTKDMKTSRSSPEEFSYTAHKSEKLYDKGKWLALENQDLGLGEFPGEHLLQKEWHPLSTQMRVSVGPYLPRQQHSLSFLAKDSVAG